MCQDLKVGAIAGDSARESDWKLREDLGVHGGDELAAGLPASQLYSSFFGRLDPAITAKKGIERHHIFPGAYLRSELKITDNKEINQIANMALVEWADNIAISDDAPHAYWPAQTAAKNFPPEMLARQQYWHALPEGWQHMDYQSFLAERRKLMGRVVKDAYFKLNEHG